MKFAGFSHTIGVILAEYGPKVWVLKHEGCGSYSVNFSETTQDTAKVRGSRLDAFGQPVEKNYEKNG